MLKVGLTGGIGSGKTLISQVFIKLGIPVFNADSEAKKITNSDKFVINALKTEFGDDIYIDDKINRNKLAELIFKDQEVLKKVNSIIHPKVREYFALWYAKQNSPYVIEEAAILFESGVNKELDFTINVHADELVRVDRVKLRDNITIEKIKDRMQNQLSDEKRIELADFTIYNDGDQMVLPQILKIHNQILKGID